MAKLSRRSISRRTIEALTVEKDTVFWDRDLPGFGVRVYALGTKMYVVQSRAGGNSVRVTVGRHGVITADEARCRAARIPYAANRAVAVLSRMYGMAASWGMVPDDMNPCRSVRKYPKRGVSTKVSMSTGVVL